MAKTKVLHIITRLDRGGSAENILLTVIGLDKERYNITLVSGLSHEPVNHLMERARAGGVKLVVIKELIRGINLWWDFKALIAVYRFIKKGNYDIVHTHSSKAGIVGRWAAWLAHVPYIVHTPHGHIFYGYYNRLVSKFFAFLEQVTALFSDKMIMLTQHEAIEHIEFNIARPEKFVVIHSGVELTRFQQVKQSSSEIKATLDIPPDTLVLGTVGRLESIKGHRYLIQAAPLILKQVPGVYFLLVGDGKLRGELEQQCLKLGIQKKVIFAGWREDFPQLISIMDVFVLPSINEGQGKVLVGAMAFKKPIVATRVGGVPGLIQNNQNGVLVPPGNPNALASAIIELLTDQAKAQRLGVEGRKGIDQYSAQNMVLKIDALYKELIGNN